MKKIFLLIAVTTLTIWTIDVGALDCGRIKNLKSIVLLCEGVDHDFCKETEKDIIKMAMRYSNIPIVDRSNLANVLDEKKLIASGLTSEDYAKIGHITGASHMLKFRPYWREDRKSGGESIVIDYTLINLSTSEIEYLKTIDRMYLGQKRLDTEEEIFQRFEECRERKRSSIIDEVFPKERQQEAPAPAPAGQAEK